jgi:adenylate cyclase
VGLKSGATVIGRAPSCDIVVNVSSMSRQHARLTVRDRRCFLSDAGSRFGTMLKGAPLSAEQELQAGDVFTCGQIAFCLEQVIDERELLSEEHQLLEDSGTLIRRLETIDQGPTATTPLDAAEPSTGSHPRERRRGSDRRSASAARAGPERRSGRERRQGRFLRLLAEISKTLVTVQPLAQMLSRVVDLVFEVIPAERAFLLLRDSADEALTARVLRNRDGTAPQPTTLSRTVINKVMSERVALLAADALYDQRLDSSGSIQAMNIRSFVCAPLWNRNEVIGVLYADNPRSKRFRADDLDIFTALANYAAVAIQQSRTSELLLQETRRRERLQRYHSPGVVNRILMQGGTGLTAPLMAQERDLSVMFCDLVAFGALCEGLKPHEIALLLNRFFTKMADVIFEFEGTLDKFIGDQILSFFGAPFEQSDHADRAVEAARAMQRALADLNREPGTRQLTMRIAINSGRALTGDIGSPRRREFTVLGEVVSNAARMEAEAAKAGQIVISRATFDRLANKGHVVPLGAFTLRGRDGPIDLYEVRQ